MKIQRIFLIILFFTFSLAFSVDGYAKGGGKGGGGGRGGKSTSSHKGGQHNAPLRGLHGVGIGFYSTGYGYPAYWDSPRSGCYSCHPNLKWFDRFKSCKYRESNLRKAEEQKAMVEEYIQGGKDDTELSEASTGR